VVIDAASGNPITVNIAMDLVRRGGHVVVAGMKDKPLEGFHSDWIPTRRITLHPGAGIDTEGAVRLINEDKVPTAALIGETFALDRFEDAFALLTRKVPGRDAVRVALNMSGERG
jgi:threonine dehydrogenase-like Zn-dependent dehydrogenase